MEGKVQLNVSCDPQERKHWSATARAEGMSFAEWVRTMLNIASNNKPKSK